jgi:hypothetical protein
MMYTNSERVARWRDKKMAQGLCGTCGKRPFRVGKRECVDCAVRRRSTSAKYRGRKRAEFRSAGLCMRCGKPKGRSTRKTLCSVHALDSLNRARQRRSELRAQAYACGCACCGEREPLFLSIDHINGRGCDERKLKGTRRVTILKAYVEGRRPDLQVLCMNCNLGKHLNGGICPHQNSAAAVA